MRQHVFNLSGNRATVTLYDPDCPNDWTVKVYRGGQFITSSEGLSETKAIEAAQNTLNYWKQSEN